MKTEPSVLGYSDYREYLRDYYKEQKARYSQFSYRAFALRAKLSSPNYLKLVMDGERRITDKNLTAFLKGLRLKDHEAKYFTLLVQFENSSDEDRKLQLQKEMRRLRQSARLKAVQLEKDREEIFKQWHPWILRELVLLSDFSDDPSWIVKKLKGRLTESQVLEGFEVLLRLGFLKKDPNGKFFQSEALITTSDDKPSVSLRQIHARLLDFTKESILEDAVSDREINGLTMAVAESEVPELKLALREFRRYLNQRFSRGDESPAADQVVHLTLAMIPMTQKTSTLCLKRGKNEKNIFDSSCLLSGDGGASGRRARERKNSV